MSEVLNRLAFARELLEGASRESKAFAHAARVIRGLPGDLRSMLASGELTRVRGIGASTRKIVREVLEGREPTLLVELEAQIPPGIFAIRRIQGLGPAKIRKLWQELGITTVGELEHACLENRLVLLEGFGKKTQANALEAIAAMERAEGVLLRSRAMEVATPLVASLVARGIRAEILGDLRRGKELVTDLAIVVVGDEPLDDVQCDVRRTDDARFGVIAVLGTAAREHIDALRAHATMKGFDLRDEGLFDPVGKLVPCADESALYAALGLVTTPPERREKDVPLVSIGKVVPRLIELRDLRGALHNHTIESDGTGTLEEMRAAAIAMELEYLGISDHSQSANYARGLSPEALRAQIATLAKLRGTSEGCVLLTGVESDILEDGQLDYDDDVLRGLEIVIASVHKRHGLDRETTTARMVRAAKNPFTDVLGHPTGRLLLGRAPNDFDVAAMLEAAAESGCAVELNASPHRLDLNDIQCAMAKERGVLVSIAADAHAPSELMQLEHGIAIARRAGLTPDDVLNCMPLNELRTWLAERRNRQGALR